MPKIAFSNATNHRAQISYTINNSGVHNFQVEAGNSDASSLANAGDTVSFWWRNDDNPCEMCAEKAPPCSLNEFLMPDQDVGIRLSDPRWPKQTI